MGALRIAAYRISFASIALALCACGGGGGGGGAVPPAAPVSAGSPGTPAPSAPASVQFSITIPAVAVSASRRRPAYVSAGTKSVAVTVNAQTQIIDCTTVCNGTIVVLPGTQTFAAALYDGPGGTGNVLSKGQTTTTIVAGTANTVKMTFNGVPAKVALALGAASVTTGTPATIPVTVSAIDAAGYTIVGSDPYANAIALADDDTSGATTLSTASITAPSAVVTLAYTGGAAAAAVHVAARVPGTALATQTATLTIAAAAATSFPDHVLTHAYYGLNSINKDIPASWMAQHVDIVEDDGFTAPHADAFKRAGGKVALAYTDPTYVPYCSAPFTAPAGGCQGPIGNLAQSDETAWSHDASGARVHRAVGGGFQYQEVLNVGSASAAAAYAQTTAAILAASPLLDGFEADDSGSALNVPGGAAGSNLFGGFSGTGVEFPSDAAWITGETAMLKAAGKPVMINGGDPATDGPAYNGAFLDLPYVRSQQFEGCFNNGGGYLYSDADLFAKELTGLLLVQAHHKQAVCFPTGDTTSAHRLYAYAAWLLAFDPQYSVYETNVPQSDGYAVYPETQLVALQPLRTATEASQLKQNGLYVREFSACGIAGVAIGPCATIVNASSSASAAVAGLTQSYGRQIALDAQSLYTGGKAHVVAGTPASLAPETAAILVK